MSEINLFGHNVKLKTHECSLFDNDPIKIKKPYITIYVKTNGCNAKCKFCTYTKSNKFNESKYKEILSEVSSKILINKIGVTGGEPTLKWDNFLKITNISREYIPHCELSLNTNGYNWNKLFDESIYEKYDFIQLSRHHYNDNINKLIFGTETPKSKDIEYVTNKIKNDHLIQLRCTLIKNNIDNKDEIIKYLNWCNNIGINDIGFTSLMPNNDFSINNFIDIDDNYLIDSNLYLSKCRNRSGCKCFNYIYLPYENFRRPIRIYHKNTFEPSLSTDLLVFDGENLTIGFNGNIIY